MPALVARLRGRGARAGGQLKEQIVRRAREYDRLEAEASALRSGISTMRHERDQLHQELGVLRRQLPDLNRERDELLAAIGPLRTELSDLRARREQVRRLESEVRTLRQQKSSLDRQIVAALRASADHGEHPPPRRRVDDS